MTHSPAAIGAHLAALDASLGELIEIVGPPPSRKAIPVADRFERLATAILHQQLAGAAARTITSRVIERLGGSIEPEAILELPEGGLRPSGVSEAKERALFDLARRVDDGRLNLRTMARRNDDDVISELSEVRGIGRWTAEMFLMGPLGRHDIWPTGDLGVRNGWALIRRSPTPVTPKILEGMGDPYRPYRSSVAWYCWRAVDVARQNGGILPG